MSPREPFKAQTLQILRERGVPVGTVLDVGVCHGTPELMQDFPEPRHLLFEPISEFEATIRPHYRNMDAELHLVAVGDPEGVVGLKISAVLQGMSISPSRMVEGCGPVSPTLPTR